MLAFWAGGATSSVAAPDEGPTGGGGIIFGDVRLRQIKMAQIRRRKSEAEMLVLGML